jgi:AraC-like DNA-binding protein
MRQIVERVDAHLTAHPSLDVMSRGFGLSLALLRSGKTPLAQLSLDLGFCSQSHFTRLFSSLTGLTPYQFSREWRPVEG